jgi:hypothetical protein
MLLVLVSITILVGLFAKSYIDWFDYIVVILLGILMFFAVNPPDFVSYSKAYVYIGTGAIYIDTGYGWLILCKIGNMLGLDYKMFSILMVIVSCLFISNSVRYFVSSKQSRTYVWTFYLIYPSLLDLVQVRFFVAEALIILSLKFLIRKDFYGNTFYAILCTIATFIHSSFIFYFLFLLIPVFQKFKKYVMPFTIVLIFLLFLGRKELYQFAELFINTTRIDRYFNSYNAVGYFGITAYLLTLFSFWYIAKCVISTIELERVSIQKKQFIEMFYQISIFIWIILPLTILDTSFFRLQRPLWIILYIVLTIQIEERNYRIKLLNNYGLKTKNLGLLMAAIGFFVYICLKHFNIVQIYLL